MIPSGFGDDQDVDQYHTGFGEWKSELYSRLGVDKADAAGAEGDGPVKTDDDRDLREERQKLGIVNAFSFMIRVRLPAGFCTAEDG